MTPAAAPARAGDAPAGRKTFAPGTRVTLLAGAHPPTADEALGQSVIAQGRTAAMLVELALGALHYEDLEFGTVHLDLTPKKVTLRVERVCQPVHLAEREPAP
jgi:hypothetical protein